MYRESPGCEATSDLAEPVDIERVGPVEEFSLLSDSLGGVGGRSFSSMREVLRVVAHWGDRIVPSEAEDVGPGDELGRGPVLFWPRLLQSGNEKKCVVVVVTTSVLVVVSATIRGGVRWPLYGGGGGEERLGFKTGEDSLVSMPTINLEV